MQLLINQSSQGATEIQQLTGSYYQNNRFERIQTDWLLAQEALQKLVGKAVMNRALEHYHSDDFISLSDSYSPLQGGSGGVGSLSSAEDLSNELVHHLQIVIAYKATFNYYQSNIVSHEDAGRTVKIDKENEKLPWEWMLDRDDRAQLKKINETGDRLFTFLEENSIREWIESDQRKATRDLFVNTSALFHEAYPIDMSPRFYYTIVPFIREVQTRTIKKAIGAEYSKLLAYWKTFADTDNPEDQSSSASASAGLPAEAELDEYYEGLLHDVQKVVPLLTMVLAVKRLSLQVLPDGVVQKFQSEFQAIHSSKPALVEVIRMHCEALTEDAEDALDDIKGMIQANDPEATDYQLLPTNDESNKFFRT